MKNLELQKKWFKDNANHLAKYSMERKERIRLEMVTAYGGLCKDCGENNPLVLVLDHINNDGATDRREGRGQGGYKLYAKLRKANWPKEDLQLLCHNCNYLKELRRRHAIVLERIENNAK